MSTSTLPPVVDAAWVAEHLGEEDLLVARLVAVQASQSIELLRLEEEKREADRVNLENEHLRRLSRRTADEARVIKLMINMMVFMSTAVIGEGLAFGERSGLDRSLMVDAINDSIVGSAHYRTKADKLKQREYGAAGPISLVVKDLDLALAVARDNAVVA